MKIIVDLCAIREPNVQNEFYEKRPSPFENQLIKEFASPNEKAKGLSEQSKSFTGIQKSPSQAEAMVLEKKVLEQVDLIESHPLGFARCQVYNTYIIN